MYLTLYISLKVLGSEFISALHSGNLHLIFIIESTLRKRKGEEREGREREGEGEGREGG